MDTENRDFMKLFRVTTIFSVFCILVCTSIFVFLPAEDTHAAMQPAIPVAKVEKIKEDPFAHLDKEAKTVLNSKKVDAGLNLYRQAQSKAAVEWFYTHLTENREVSMAILEEAEKNDIPLPLAFALCHTESRFKPRAKNVNTNESIDRGLFQLNNTSFPYLSESEFFDPKVSAKYGMSHLKYCLKTAGNEIAALAMYNAGANKVRRGATPQMTLNYISQIENYRAYIEEHFNSEVVAFYSEQSLEKLLARR